MSLLLGILKTNNLTGSGRPNFSMRIGTLQKSLIILKIILWQMCTFKCQGLAGLEPSPMLIAQIN